MEIKTCEQYVLAQLLEQQDENDRIMADNRALRTMIENQENELADLERRMKSAMEQAIRREGGQTILKSATNDSKWRAPTKDYDGNQVAYEAWVVMLAGGRIPDDVSFIEFLREFDSGLRTLYTDCLREAGLSDDDQED